jgi:hypothetical protein
MADNKDTPSRSANMHKAEGERWTSDPDTVEVRERYAEGVGENMEQGGGISNRPLSEEISRQESLPERNKSRSEETGEGRRDETTGVER